MFKKYVSKIASNFVGRDKLGLYVCDVGYIEAFKNYECKTRVLSDYYLIAVLKGKGSFVSKDKHFDLSVGDIYFLLPDVLHSYKTCEKELLNHVWIGFNGHNAKMLLDTIGVDAYNAVINLDTSSEVFKSIKSIYDVLDKDSYSSAIECSSYLYKIFADLAKYKDVDKKHGQSLKTELSNPVQKAQEYMESNFANPISIFMVADFVGLSRSYFTTLFLKETGITPLEFLKNVRMNQATYYLKNTGFTIKEIAHSVGYDNGLYFSKDFSKRFGVCPSEYRKKG